MGRNIFLVKIGVIALIVLVLLPDLSWRLVRIAEDMYSSAL